MISTGIIRSIDSLGRVVLPKELRRTFEITTDTPLEIMTEGDDQEQLLAAEQAESHARIEHEPQLHHMGDERHSAYRLQNLHRPQFDQLVDADQRSHSCQIEEYKCH